MEHPDDDRPFGWGACEECGEDAAEDDYNPHTRISLHLTCHLKRARRAFYLACEAHGVTDDELEVMEIKGMV